jgi:prophage regulatory protein
MTTREILRRERARKRAKQEQRHGRRVLRLPAVEEKTGLKKSQIYDDMREGRFPQGVALGPRAVGWIEDEVDAWIEARIKARDDGTAVRSIPPRQRRDREEATS